MAKAQEGNSGLRLKIAQDKLSAARTLLENKFYNDTISKAYYAMFYASKALLLELGEDPTKHTGVVNLFGDRIVRVGYADPQYGRTIRKLKELREVCDYSEYKQATKEEAEIAIRDAEEFVNEAYVILKKIRAREKK